MRKRSWSSHHQGVGPSEPLRSLRSSTVALFVPKKSVRGIRVSARTSHTSTYVLRTQLYCALSIVLLRCFTQGNSPAHTGPDGRYWRSLSQADPDRAKSGNARPLDFFYNSENTAVRALKTRIRCIFLSVLRWFGSLVGNLKVLALLARNTMKNAQK